MKVFHRTWSEYAASILQNGFNDGIVQVSDRPLDATEIKGGGGGDVLLQIDIGEDVAAQFEDKDTHYKNLGVRVFVIPSAVVNSHPVEFSESDYIGMTTHELMRSLASTKGSPHKRPKAIYTQDVVLEKALAFLEEVQGNDEQRRHALIAQEAYLDWENDPDQTYWGDDQRYWYAAEMKVNQFIQENGGVPYR